MNPIARDLGKLRHATREIELTERQARSLENAGSMWDLETVETWCAIMQKLWDAGNIASITGADPRLNGAVHLLMAADRDLAAYRKADLTDPNRLLAGRAALTGVEMAVNELLSIRNALQQELFGVYAEWDRPDVPTDAGGSGSGAGA